MGKFMHHEPISAGLFNLNYHSVGPSMSSWENELTNHPDCRLLQLLCDRMEKDWTSLAVKMRTPYNLAKLDSSH